MSGAYRPLAFRLGPICDLCWLRFGQVVAVGSESDEGQPCPHRPRRHRRPRRVTRLIEGVR